MLYALLAIAVLVLLVTWLKLNPFIALLISSLTLWAMVVATSGALTMAEVLKAFQTGFGNTLAGTGAIIVLGVVFGKLLAESGGAGVSPSSSSAHSGRRASASASSCSRSASA